MSTIHTGFVVEVMHEGEVACLVCVPGCPDLFTLPRNLLVPPHDLPRDATNSQIRKHQSSPGIGDTMDFECVGRKISEFQRCGRRQDIEFRSDGNGRMQAKFVCGFSNESPRRCYSSIFGSIPLRPDTPEYKEILRVLHDVPVTCWMTLNIDYSTGHMTMELAEIVEIPYEESESFIMNAPWLRHRNFGSLDMGYDDDEYDFEEQIEPKPILRKDGGILHPNGNIARAKGVVISEDTVFFPMDKKTMLFGLKGSPEEHPKVGTFIEADSYHSMIHEKDVIRYWERQSKEPLKSNGNKLLVKVMPYKTAPGIYEHKKLGLIYDQFTTISLHKAGTKTGKSFEVWVKHIRGSPSTGPQFVIDRELPESTQAEITETFEELTQLKSNGFLMGNEIYCPEYGNICFELQNEQVKEDLDNGTCVYFHSFGGEPAFTVKSALGSTKYHDLPAVFSMCGPAFLVEVSPVAREVPVLLEHDLFGLISDPGRIVHEHMLRSKKPKIIFSVWVAEDPSETPTTRFKVIALGKDKPHASPFLQGYPRRQRFPKEKLKSTEGRQVIIMRLNGVGVSQVI
uniref:FAD-binding FR-type domain-containing protein n=1 Tax=Steinernema glaseri TaxID=37863 RepID=A0A1I7ZSG2_9BILA